MPGERQLRGSLGYLTGTLFSKPVSGLFVSECIYEPKLLQFGISSAAFFSH